MEALKRVKKLFRKKDADAEPCAQAAAGSVEGELRGSNNRVGEGTETVQPMAGRLPRVRGLRSHTVNSKAALGRLGWSS